MNSLMMGAVVAILLYGLMTARVGWFIIHGAQLVPQQPKAVLWLGLFAIIGHAVSLYDGIFGQGGLALGFFNVFSLLGWIMVVMLLIGAFFKPLLGLGIAIFPGAAMTLLLVLLFPSRQIVLIQGGWPMYLHVLSSLLAYSLFALAALQVLMLALQDHALHNHRAIGIIRCLPPLQTMETLLFQMLFLGFVLLSLSLLTGAFYIHDMFAQHLAHKTTFSIVAWLVFAGLFWGRWRYGWRGQTTTTWTLSGFIALGLAYPVTKFILEIVLQR